MWKIRSQKGFEEMQNMSQIARRSIQDATDVTMTKKQVNTISTSQAYWVRLLWIPVHKVAELREEKGMGLLIHLRN